VRKLNKFHIIDDVSKRLGVKPPRAAKHAKEAVVYGPEDYAHVRETVRKVVRTKLI